MTPSDYATIFFLHKNHNQTAAQISTKTGFDLEKVQECLEVVGQPTDSDFPENLLRVFNEEQLDDIADKVQEEFIRDLKRLEQTTRKEQERQEQTTLREQKRLEREQERQERTTRKEQERETRRKDGVERVMTHNEQVSLASKARKAELTNPHNLSPELNEGVDGYINLGRQVASQFGIPLRRFLHLCLTDARSMG